MKHSYVLLIPSGRNRVRATASLHNDGGGEWTIDRINVPDIVRGKGHGSTLLKSICEDADRRGIILKLHIIAGDGLTHAQLESWYRRHGFKIRNALTHERIPKAVSISQAS